MPLTEGRQVEGRRVTVDLVAETSVDIRGAGQRRAAADHPPDSGSQSRFSALRSFDILSCNATTADLRRGRGRATTSSTAVRTTPSRPCVRGPPCRSSRCGRSTSPTRGDARAAIRAGQPVHRQDQTTRGSQPEERPGVQTPTATPRRPARPGGARRRRTARCGSPSCRCSGRSCPRRRRPSAAGDVPAGPASLAGARNDAPTVSHRGGVAVPVAARSRPAAHGDLPLPTRSSPWGGANSLGTQ